MKSKNEIKPVEVFAGTALQAGMVKSLLENAEIEAFLKDEIVGTLHPWHASPGGAGAVKVFVSSTDFDNAISIVAEYEKHLKED
jgi:hypothetical protein